MDGKLYTLEVHVKTHPSTHAPIHAPMHVPIHPFARLRTRPSPTARVRVPRAESSSSHKAQTPTPPPSPRPRPEPHWKYNLPGPAHACRWQIAAGMKHGTKFNFDDAGVSFVLQQVDHATFTRDGQDLSWYHQQALA